MSDRKTINKYYPPDFDPSKISKRKKVSRESLAASLQTVRLMAPFSMRCTTCGEFIYRGKKFNARKQPTGESYLGIKIIRFYIRCPRCSGEIRFKTDPKIGDYVTELGAERNREPWREKAEEEEDLEQRLDRLEREESEQHEKDEQRKLYGMSGAAVSGSSTVDANSTDIMADLESKVLDSKREMDIQDELDEIRSRNARIELASSSVNGGGLLEKAQENVNAGLLEKRKLEEEQDDEAARKAFKRTSDGDIIRSSSLKPVIPSPSVAVAKSQSVVMKGNDMITAATKSSSSVNGFNKFAKGGKKAVNSLGVVVKKKKSLV